MCRKYVNALKQNIDERFAENMPNLTAFAVLYVVPIAYKNNPQFKDYGQKCYKFSVE